MAQRQVLTDAKTVAIKLWAAHWDDNPKPFNWEATADGDIIETSAAAGPPSPTQMSTAGCA